MAFLIPSDLEPFASIEVVKALALIEDATEFAVLEAPALADEDELSDRQRAQVKAVLRGAVLRRNDAGSGVVQTKQLGSASETIDTARSRSFFTESEIDQLQKIVQDAGSSGAFSIDTVNTQVSGNHSDVCSLVFGASICSGVALRPPRISAGSPPKYLKSTNTSSTTPISVGIICQRRRMR